MRAMTFESLVHSERFVSELLTKTIGQLGLPRPTNVARSTCNNSVDANRQGAQGRRTSRRHFADTATMITALGVPYLNLEHESATAVLPDFAIVAPRRDGDRGRRLVADHGRRQGLRASPRRIDDAPDAQGVPPGRPRRRVRGRVEPAAERHAGAPLRRAGRAAQCVPAARGRGRAARRPPSRGPGRGPRSGSQRRGSSARTDPAPRSSPTTSRTEGDLRSRPAASRATCSPTAAASCAPRLQPRDLLIEIGIAPAMRPLLAGSRWTGPARSVWCPPASLDQVTATLDGLPVWSERRRTDPCGQPGAIDVVLAKADAAALGIHGVAVRRGGGPWDRRTFLEPQAPTTRRGVVEMIGEGDRRRARRPDASAARRRAGPGHRRRPGLRRGLGRRGGAVAGCGGSATWTRDGRP